MTAEDPPRPAPPEATAAPPPAMVPRLDPPRPRRWVAAVAAHPRHVVLGALVVGLAAGPPVPVVPWIAAAGGVLVAVVALAGGLWGARVAVIFGLAAAAAPVGAWVAQARLAALDRTALGPLIGHAADERVTVLQPPRARSFGRSVFLGGLGSGERVAVRAKGAATAEAGDIVRVRGGWRTLPPFEQALARAGAHALIAADVVQPTGARRGGVLGGIDAVRRRAERALATGLPPPLAGLARGMVLGEDEGLPAAMADDFRASGLAHLVAASGANVALLAALALAIGAALGLPRTVRLVAALALIAAYVPLAGGGPSIQRAGVMGATAIVAALASQPAARWYALLLAAAATLVLNPRALADPGWQLSFAAVVGLMALAPPLRRGLGRRLPAAVADAVAVSLAASLATAPLIARHFGRLSWVTLPANLLAAPAVAPIMWLGVAAATVGQLAARLATPFTALAAWPLAFVAWVGHAAARLPGANAEVRLGAVGALAWAALLLVLALPRVRRRLGRPALGGSVAHRAGRLAVVLVAGVVVVAAAARGRRPPSPPPGLTVAALDVGQGDATLVRDGPHAVLVDTGPPDGPILQRLDEQGVDRLDVLVVTHAQGDHVGGAAAVLAAKRVGLVLDGRDGVRTPEGDRFAAAARARGVRMVAGEAGRRVTAGPIVLDVLSPRPEPPRAQVGEDSNQRAIVAEVRDGAFSMLLTADAESDVLSTLPLEPVDVLKVSHHGSADPGLPQLLERLRPTTALIEVGRQNVYGHPAPATLAALAAVPNVHRTDEEGTVVLRP